MLEFFVFLFPCIWFIAFIDIFIFEAKISAIIIRAIAGTITYVRNGFSNKETIKYHIYESVTYTGDSFYEVVKSKYIGRRRKPVATAYLRKSSPDNRPMYKEYYYPDPTIRSVDILKDVYQIAKFDNFTDAVEQCEEWKEKDYQEELKLLEKQQLKLNKTIIKKNHYTI